MFYYDYPGHSLKEISTHLREKFFTWAVKGGFLQSWLCKRITYSDSHRKTKMLLIKKFCVEMVLPRR
jgi:hypothetical protein